MKATIMKRRRWYDCEFIEDGRTVDLISIGIVADDGREYYAVNRDAPWRRVRRHPWLMANVVPHLPKPSGDWNNHMPKRWLFDFNNPAVKAKATIAAEVRDFLRHGVDLDDAAGWPELWAWYGAYDHVCLAQLWGPMVDLPPGIPMWTNDLQQEITLHHPGAAASLPEQVGKTHNALDDARHLRACWDHVMLARPGAPADPTATP
jgi:hypothetical protein